MTLPDLASLLSERTALYDIEKLVRAFCIQEALRLERGHQCRAADRLGIHRNSLALELKKG